MAYLDNFLILSSGAEIPAHVAQVEATLIRAMSRSVRYPWSSFDRGSPGRMSSIYFHSVSVPFVRSPWCLSRSCVHFVSHRDWDPLAGRLGLDSSRSFFWPLLWELSFVSWIAVRSERSPLLLPIWPFGSCCGIRRRGSPSSPLLLVSQCFGGGFHCVGRV